jgi:hypothetical protein
MAKEKTVKGKPKEKTREVTRRKQNEYIGVTRKEGTNTNMETEQKEDNWEKNAIRAETKMERIRDLKCNQGEKRQNKRTKSSEQKNKSTMRKKFKRRLNKKREDN